VNIPIHPSNCIITKYKADKDRNALVDRKSRARSDKVKGGKYTGKDVGLEVD